eukprot:TRINITY_DN14177_c0_g1_i1.p1 TRINITY_DN14177_c0_g1~~TRINITY_DN14177_c0_g1_i1.p1  ORF type:complete len:595 (-),score=91.86 TRINITY_DN14177_c0_g1_i1:283-2067(-)
MRRAACPRRLPWPVAGRGQNSRHYWRPVPPLSLGWRRADPVPPSCSLWPVRLNLFRLGPAEEAHWEPARSRAPSPKCGFSLPLRCPQAGGDCAGDVQKSDLSRVYVTDTFFQAQSMYMTFFILRFRSALVVLPAAFTVYAAITGGCWGYLKSIAPSSGIRMISVSGLCADLTLMAITLAFVLYGKGMLERSQRGLHGAFERQRQEYIKEKVLRCSAEFAHSNLQEQVKAQDKQEFDLADEEQAVNSVAASKLCASVASAPAVMDGAQIDDSDDDTSTECSSSGDCLPADALVWIEGSGAPKALSALTPGERVLCHDNLTGHMKYADITSVEPAQATVPPDWVHVSLADGTVLEMTADHPVETFPRFEVKNQKVIRKQAHELSTVADKLVVLKMVKVPVCKVVRRSPDIDTVPAKQWMTLNVQQPQRHTVFVAQSGKQQGGMLSSIAVGSADLLLPSVAHVRTCFAIRRGQTQQEDARSFQYAVSAPGKNENAEEDLGYEEAAMLFPATLKMHLDLANGPATLELEAASEQGPQQKVPRAADAGTTAGARRRQKQRDKRRQWQSSMVDHVPVEIGTPAFLHAGDAGIGALKILQV